MLWESISYGMRMLMRSAEVQMPAGQELGSGGNAGVLVVALAAAVVLFIGVPYLVTGLLQRLIVSAVALNVAEGLIRLALLLGYLAAISFLPDIRRVFAYHGAEHMTIHAFEHGDPLTPERIAPYPTAHARCGTAFLLVVVVVAIVVFAFVPRVNVIVDIAKIWSYGGTSSREVVAPQLVTDLDHRRYARLSVRRLLDRVGRCCP